MMRGSVKQHASIHDKLINKYATDRQESEDSKLAQDFRRSALQVETTKQLEHVVPDVGAVTAVQQMVTVCVCSHPQRVYATPPCTNNCNVRRSQPC